MDIKKINSDLNRFLDSWDYQETIRYLNDNDIDYATESGRGTKWTDLEIYIYFLKHKAEIQNS